jgi:hypothetical protein
MAPLFSAMYRAMSCLTVIFSTLRAMTVSRTPGFSTAFRGY